MKDPSPPTSLAPHHLRLFALIVDYMLIITLLKLIDQLVLGEHWDLLPVVEDAPPFSLWWVAGLALMVICKDIFHGRSVGKWLAGIAVAAPPELAHPPGLKRCLLRNLTLPLLPVEALVLFMDPHGRRLGDRLAGTVVVVPAIVPNLMRRLTSMAILFLAVMLTSFLATPWNMRRSAAYQTAYREAARHPSVIQAVGEPARPDSSPQFSLTLEPRGGAAQLTFEVEGPRGLREVKVMLKLGQAPRRWAVESLRLLTPEDAGKNEPLIQQAPPRK